MTRESELFFLKVEDPILKARVENDSAGRKPGEEIFSSGLCSGRVIEAILPFV